MIENQALIGFGHERDEVTREHALCIARRCSQVNLDAQISWRYGTRAVPRDTRTLTIKSPALFLSPRCSGRSPHCIPRVMDATGLPLSPPASWQQEDRPKRTAAWYNSRHGRICSWRSVLGRATVGSISGNQARRAGEGAHGVSKIVVPTKEVKGVQPVFNQGKFDNLVLYIVSQCPDPTRLGAARGRCR